MKEKNNEEYTDILRIFAPIPVPPLWPLSIFHAECSYAKDYKTPFTNFLQYNAWNYQNEIDIPYHSCGDKILKYEVEGNTIKFPNLHFFFQFCFVELEKKSSDPFTYTPSISPALWPRTKEERKRLWISRGPNRKTRKRLYNNPRNRRQKGLGSSGTGVLFNLLNQNFVELFANEGFADTLVFA